MNGIHNGIHRAAKRGSSPDRWLRDPTLLIFLMFVLTAQWSGFVVGPFQLSDCFLLLALATLILRSGRGVSRPVFSLPRPIGPAVFLATISLATVLAVFFPVSGSYLANRVFLSTNARVGPSSGLGTLGLGPVLTLTKLALATLGAWALARKCVVIPGNIRIDLVQRVWLAGGLVSALVAILEKNGLINVTAFVAHTEGDRPSGLAVHPNSLGLYLAASVPFVMCLLKRRSTWWAGIASLIVFWLGLLAADSRISLVAAGFETMILPLCAIGVLRSSLIAIVVLLAVSPIILLAVSYLQNHTRLAAGGAVQSNLDRGLLLNQAFGDFLTSPYWGIGFANGGGAPSVPLGVLAGGGIVAAIGYLVFWCWIYYNGLLGIRSQDVRLMLASCSAVLVCTVVQNNLTDRAEYLPGFLAVLCAARLRIGSAVAMSAKANQARSVMAPTTGELR